MEQEATGGKVWSPEEEERKRQEYLDIIASVTHAVGAENLPVVSQRTKIVLKTATYACYAALFGLLILSFSFLIH